MLRYHRKYVSLPRKLILATNLSQHKESLHKDGSAHGKQERPLLCGRHLGREGFCKFSGHKAPTTSVRIPAGLCALPSASLSMCRSTQPYTSNDEDSDDLQKANA